MLQVKNHIDVLGKDVNGDSPDQMSWHDTIESTLVWNHLSVHIVSEVSLVLTILRYTWRDISDKGPLKTRTLSLLAVILEKKFKEKTLVQSGRCWILHRMEERRRPPIKFCAFSFLHQLLKNRIEFEWLLKTYERGTSYFWGEKQSSKTLIILASF